MYRWIPRNTGLIKTIRQGAASVLITRLYLVLNEKQEANMETGAERTGRPVHFIVLSFHQNEIA